jgi:hypothetical protein
MTDLLIVIANWGTPGPGDVDMDGNVGVTDFMLVIMNWGY